MELKDSDRVFVLVAELWECQLELNTNQGKSSRCLLSYLEESAYRYLYRREYGNISRIALLMGVSRGTAHTKLAHYNIHVPNKQKA